MTPEHKKKLNDLIEELGREDAFSLGLHLIINTTPLDTCCIDPNGDFVIMCKEEYVTILEQLGLQLKNPSQIEYQSIEEGIEEYNLYPDISKKVQ